MADVDLGVIVERVWRIRRQKVPAGGLEGLDNSRQPSTITTSHSNEISKTAGASYNAALSIQLRETAEQVLDGFEAHRVANAELCQNLIGMLRKGAVLTLNGLQIGKGNGPALAGPVALASSTLASSTANSTLASSTLTSISTC